MNFRTIAAGLLVLYAGVFPVSAEMKQREWDMDGVMRQALVWVPESIPTNGCAMIFAFHGHGGSAAQAARHFHYHEIWPEAMMVYMQGLPTPGPLTDPEGKRNGWNSKPGDPDNRDLKFFDTVLSSLQEEYNIDSKRIYCTGHSNGAGFTYCLWAARGDVFAAVAPSGAFSMEALPKLKPKPALHVAGENDTLVKFIWQQRMMSLVHQVNRCEKSGEPWASSGNLTGTLYPSESGTPLVTLIHPGGHTFPKEAPELIVRFFKTYAQKE